MYYLFYFTEICGLVESPFSLYCFTFHYVGVFFEEEGGGLEAGKGFGLVDLGGGVAVG